MKPSATDVIRSISAITTANETRGHNDGAWQCRVIRETIYYYRLAGTFNVSLHAKTELSALVIEISQMRELNP